MLLLATVGVVVSTVLVGGGFWALAAVLGLEIDLLWCLVFGALISPTDPVAVLGILRSAGTPPAFEAKVAGESLFNDGVGVVVFAILLAAATGSERFSLAHAGELFAVEAGGGVVLGLALGGLGFVVMQSLDEYNVEVLITLVDRDGRLRARRAPPHQRPARDGGRRPADRQPGGRARDERPDPRVPAELLVADR